MPMTETMYYILLSLLEPRHGYGIILNVRAITGGRLNIAPGTIYNSLGRLLREGIIEAAGGDSRRRLYTVTETGREALHTEVARLKELSRNGETSEI